MKTKKYEVLYIVAGSHTPEEVQTITDKFKGIVEKNGGTVMKAELWAKRRLAYEIKHHKDGNYVLMHFEAPPQVPAELNRLMRIDDEVIRHTIVLLHPSQEAATAEAISEVTTA